MEPIDLDTFRARRREAGHLAHALAPHVRLELLARMLGADERSLDEQLDDLDKMRQARERGAAVNDNHLDW